MSQSQNNNDLLSVNTRSLTAAFKRPYTQLQLQSRLGKFSSVPMPFNGGRNDETNNENNPPNAPDGSAVRRIKTSSNLWAGTTSNTLNGSIPNKTSSSLEKSGSIISPDLSDSALLKAPKKDITFKKPARPSSPSKEVLDSRPSRCKILDINRISLADDNSLPLYDYYDDYCTSYTDDNSEQLDSLSSISRYSYASPPSQTNLFNLLDGLTQAQSPNAGKSDIGVTNSTAHRTSPLQLSFGAVDKAQMRTNGDFVKLVKGAKNAGKQAPFGTINENDNAQQKKFYEKGIGLANNASLFVTLPQRPHMENDNRNTENVAPAPISNAVTAFARSLAIATGPNSAHHERNSTNHVEHTDDMQMIETGQKDSTNVPTASSTTAAPVFANSNVSTRSLTTTTAPNSARSDSNSTNHVDHTGDVQINENEQEDSTNVTAASNTTIAPVLANVNSSARRSPITAVPTFNDASSVELTVEKVAGTQFVKWNENEYVPDDGNDTTSNTPCNHVVLEDVNSRDVAHFQIGIQSCCKNFVYDWMTDLLAKKKIAVAVIFDLDICNAQISTRYFGRNNRSYITAANYLETGMKQIIVAGYDDIKNVKELLVTQKIRSVGLVVSKRNGVLSDTQLRVVGLVGSLATVKYLTLFWVTSKSIINQAIADEQENIINILQKTRLPYTEVSMADLNSQFLSLIASKKSTTNATNRDSSNVNAGQTTSNSNVDPLAIVLEYLKVQKNAGIDRVTAKDVFESGVLDVCHGMTNVEKIRKLLTGYAADRASGIVKEGGDRKKVGVPCQYSLMER